MTDREAERERERERERAAYETGGRVGVGVVVVEEVGGG
jgi:hypothetical protein